MKKFVKITTRNEDGSILRSWIDQETIAELSQTIQQQGDNEGTCEFVDGTIIAKELRIDYVTSSILYQSGSTKFGDTFDDTHNFTGSLRTTGSVIIDGDLTVRGTTTLTSTDPLRESLIISGAMAMMQAQIQSQIISASISMGGQRVISQEQNNIVLDLGGF
jgi:hypothetical protein